MVLGIGRRLGIEVRGEKIGVYQLLECMQLSFLKLQFVILAKLLFRRLSEKDEPIGV